MPRLHPFAALRYAGSAGPLADLIAPPYDVIDPAQAQGLRELSPFNAVRLILPEGDDEGRYVQASETLSDWKSQGILEPDGMACAYVYRQRYTGSGRPKERLSMFAALDLEPFGAGVLPHEMTHAGPKRDRLALTLATRTQLSPIFLLAKDPEASFLEALRTVVSGTPTAEATTPDGIEHSIWVVDEEGAAEVLCALGGRHPLLVADGHHRYETALEVQRQLGPGPADRVLVCVVSAEDPGLTISETHRTLRDLGDFTTAEFVSRLGAWFEVEPLRNQDLEGAAAAAAADPRQMVIVTNTPDGIAALRLSPRGQSGDAASNDGMQIAAVRFDRLVLHTLLGTDADAAAHDGRLEYHRRAADAVGRAGSDGAAFLLPAVRLDGLWEATAAGLRLPPKSTYFEPKVPSGLLFRSLGGE